MSKNIKPILEQSLNYVIHTYLHWTLQHTSIFHQILCKFSEKIATSSKMMQPFNFKFSKHNSIMLPMHPPHSSFIQSIGRLHFFKRLKWPVSLSRRKLTIQSYAQTYALLYADNLCITQCHRRAFYRLLHHQQTEFAGMNNCGDVCGLLMSNFWV